MADPPRTFLNFRQAAREARKPTLRRTRRVPSVPHVDADDEDVEDAMTVATPLRPDDVFGDTGDRLVATLLREILPRTRLLRQQPMTRVTAFRAYWSANLAQARASNDLPLAALASTLLIAVQTLPPGRLVETKLDVDGTHWAAWFDLHHRTLLGVRRPYDDALMTG